VNEQIKHAYEEYRKAVEAEAALSAEIAEREDKLPTPEDQEQFERIEADIDQWRNETKRLVEAANRASEVNEFRKQYASLFEADERDERVTDDGSRLLAMRNAVLDGRERVIDESNFKVRQSFLDQLANRFNPEKRALGISAPAIDSTFVERVYMYAVDESPMLDPAVVTVINTARGEPLTFPRLTADASTASTLTAEAAALNEADPTLSSVVLNAYKYGGITLWSAELDEDDVVNIQDVLARSAARHIVEQANAPLTTGDGSNKPNGIVNAASNGGTASGTANNTFFGPDDIIDLFYGRKAAYRRNGNWMASTTGLAKIRKLQTSTGEKIWAASIAPGQPETVLGRPIFENPDMAAVASASKSVLFGDTHQYLTRRVGSARVEVSRDYKFNTDQLAIKVVERLDGDLLDANAVAYLVSANA
jgi:HK97 family phage major capsid protein